MAEERAQRRLAAILAADVVGYSRLMEQDEARTLAALKQRRRDILKPLVAEHHGRIVKASGAAGGAGRALSPVSPGGASSWCRPRPWAAPLLACKNPAVAVSGRIAIRLARTAPHVDSTRVVDRRNPYCQIARFFLVSRPNNDTLEEFILTLRPYRILVLQQPHRHVCLPLAPNGAILD